MSSKLLIAFFSFTIFLSQTGIAQNDNVAHPFVNGASIAFSKTSKDSIKIVSWNVEHFTDTVDNPYIKNKMEDSSQVKEEKLQLFANVLKAIDGDVVVLQEFESAAYAKLLAENYFPELGYGYFTSSESPDWYMNVVVMSRIPLGITQTYGALYTTSHYEKDSTLATYTQAHLNQRILTTTLYPTPELEIFLTGVHLKAGRRARDTAVRVSQLELIKGHHEQLMKGKRKAGLLLLGDFNATPQSLELSIAKKGKRKWRLYDGLKPTIYSHPAENPTWRLDYILFNRVMQKRSSMENSKIETVYSPAEMRQISDHLPLSIQFYIK